MKPNGKSKACVKLSPEELAVLDEGLRSESTGREYTLDEALSFARERRKAWTKKPKDLSA